MQGEQHLEVGIGLRGEAQQRLAEMVGPPTLGPNDDAQKRWPTSLLKAANPVRTAPPSPARAEPRRTVPSHPEP